MSVIDRIGSGIDRLVGIVNPRAEVRRRTYRHIAAAVRSQRQYAAAKSPRALGAWAPGNQNINDILQASTATVRARVRQLVRDFPYFARAANLLVDLTVGTGLKYQARVRAPGGGLNKAMNRRLEDAFRWWADEADISGKLHFYELMRLAKRQDVENGEFFVVLTQSAERNRYLPLALQMFESDHVAEHLSTHNTKTAAGTAQGTEIRLGVEYEISSGKPLAYHFTDPWRYGRTQRIEASRVVHGFETLRPGQLRGISPFVSAILTAHNLRDYMDAEMDAAKMASRWLAFIQTNDLEGFQSARTVTDSETSRAIEELETAVIEYLRPGESVQFPSHNRAGTNFGEFVKLVLRMLAVVAGVSYELLSGDYSELSYTSLRGVRNDLMKSMESMQDRHRRQFCTPVFRAFLDWLYFSGKVAMPGYARDPWPYMECVWTASGMEPVDPLREGRADADRIDQLLMSPQEAAAKRGRDYEEILNEIAEAKRMQDERGLVPLDVAKALQTNPAAVAGGE